jgi:hypothetical protein
MHPSSSQLKLSKRRLTGSQWLGAVAPAKEFVTPIFRLRDFAAAELRSVRR